MFELNCLFPAPNSIVLIYIQANFTAGFLKVAVRSQQIEKRNNWRHSSGYAFHSTPEASRCEQFIRHLEFVVSVNSLSKIPMLPRMLEKNLQLPWKLRDKVLQRDCHAVKYCLISVIFPFGFRFTIRKRISPKFKLCDVQ